ncbi:MAG: glycosyltransferase family 4 protein [Thalassobaculales bacterium]
MRLLAVGHSYVSPFAQAKYAALKRQGVSLRLVVPPVAPHLFMPFPAERHPDLTAQEHVVLPAHFAGRVATWLPSPRRLARLVAAFEPDIIHVEEDPHSACGLLLALLARGPGRRAALSWFTWDNLDRRPPFPLDLVKRGMQRFGFGRARLVVCGNRAGQGLLAAKGYGGPSVVLPQVGLVAADHAGPPGIDHRARLPAGPLVGFVGRLVAEKGVEDLAAAMQGLPGRLVTVGAGPLAGALAAAGALVQPPVPHAGVADWLKALDIFVLPSRTTARWAEQFGLTLAQAMLCGLACVGSDSGAIPEVLGDAGVIVPEGDVPALRAVLERLIADPAERARLGAAARARALAQFTDEAVAAGYRRAFAQALAA